jgi:hypothetical protein
VFCRHFLALEVQKEPRRVLAGWKVGHALVARQVGGDFFSSFELSHFDQTFARFLHGLKSVLRLIFSEQTYVRNQLCGFSISLSSNDGGELSLLGLFDSVSSHFSFLLRDLLLLDGGCELV